jgi:methanogenic corrinoid protein MtbC1
VEIKDAVINGDMERIEQLVSEALKNGIDSDSLLKEMIEGMEEVGKRFENKEYYVPETLLSAHTMKLGLELLRPYLPVEKSKKQRKVLIGAVESDIHDIGLNLVAMFLDAAGFEIHNLGRDVQTSLFLERAKEIEPDIIGLSAMMSTTALKLKEVIKEFEKEGLRKGRLFVVGGAALSEELARELNADAYAADAKKAVRVFESLLEKSG